jgi:hypothetical protein
VGDVWRIGKDIEGSCVELIEVIPCLWGTRKSMETLSKYNQSEAVPLR